MSNATPEPHFLPGYVGHCSKSNYYIGGTYAQLTHKSLISPCVPHGRDINLTPIHIIQNADSPTAKEKAVLKNRQQFVDAVFRYPIIPGYGGFVPRLEAQIGKRYMAAASSAVVEHEEIMERRRCELRNLTHNTILQSGQGLFLQHMGERMLPRPRYPAPLVPIPTEDRANKVFERYGPAKDKLSYSKFTTPHFKENEDEDKWIKQGYCGHIPQARFLCGASNRPLTHTALNQFLDHIRHRRYNQMSPDTRIADIECPDDGCQKLDCQIYRSDYSMIPHYAGHVPGRRFQAGERIVMEMGHAKNWLRHHRLEATRNRPPGCGEHCR